MKISPHSKDVVPMSAPPEASGTIEVSAVNVFVRIPEVPLSIAPNPEVIDPESKAPVVTILPPPTL